MSSNFFGGLQSGIRFPSAEINEHGPLPEAPYAGIDGQINATSSLLDNVSPYAQPKQGAMGSDRNYQQIPHRMQQIVPMLFLPSADKQITEPCRVSHPVDFGDIAFSLVSDNVVSLMTPHKQAANIVRAPARNVFCNLITANYLLAGLQRLEATDRNNWSQFAVDMGYDYMQASMGEEEQMRELLRLVATRFLPYGIVQGSEKQGGQHETTLAPVQAAVNFVVTMTVDGQNRDLINFWRESHISAGDQLIYTLEKRPTCKFVLNHYYKQMAKQSFREVKTCWQLVPRVFRSAEATRYSHEKGYHDTELYDYRINGYWRLAQSFQHRAPMHDSMHYADDTVFLKGQLLQVTFAPVWIQMESVQKLPGRTKAKQNDMSDAGVEVGHKRLRDILLTHSRTNQKVAKKTIAQNLQDHASAAENAPQTSARLQHMLAASALPVGNRMSLMRGSSVAATQQPVLTQTHNVRAQAAASNAAEGPTRARTANSVTAAGMQSNIGLGRSSQPVSMGSDSQAHAATERQQGVPISSNSPYAVHVPASVNGGTGTTTAAAAGEERLPATTSSAKKVKVVKR